jgi:hypothetical protein
MPAKPLFVGPFLGDRKSPHRGSPKNQSVNSRDSARFQDGKLLTTKGVIGMGDFSMFRRRTVNKCI